MNRSEPPRADEDVANGESDESDDRMTHGLPEPASRTEPGGPYFGRLLIVLLLAVAFCGFMTWLLGSRLAD